MMGQRNIFKKTTIVATKQAKLEKSARLLPAGALQFTQKVTKPTIGIQENINPMIAHHKPACEASSSITDAVEYAIVRLAYKGGGSVVYVT